MSYEHIDVWGFFFCRHRIHAAFSSRPVDRTNNFYIYIFLNSYGHYKLQLSAILSKTTRVVSSNDKAQK